jgi:hypothetical protein
MTMQIALDRLAIDEDHARPFPVERLGETLGPDGQVETAFEGVSRHAAKALGEAGGIAIIAAGADLGATSHRVPRCIGPLYGAFFRHDFAGSAAGVAK